MPVQPDSVQRDPSLFISHKHADKKIADVIREFIYQRTNREVAVFQSSAADADAPELGHALAGELRDALWQSGVVILVYTTEDQDWQWCMWECGVALNPASPDTRVIVFQCAAESPRVFQDSVRVNVREREDVLKFVKTFLTNPLFFPGMGSPIAPKLSPDGPEVAQFAEVLFAELAKVIPRSNLAEWAAQPLLQLQLPIEVCEKIAAEPGEGGDLTIQVADLLSVSSLDPQARQIFGVADLSPGTKLSGLAMRWAEKHSARPLDWVRDIEAQVRRAARNDIPVIGWGYLQAADNGPKHIPLLSRTRRLPSIGSVQFDVNLVRFDEFAATRAVARMIPWSEVVCHHVDRTPLTELKVLDLARRFKAEQLSRMPFVQGDGGVVLMVHRSMVDRFVTERVTSGDLADIKALSFADLLQADQALKQIFETSFAAVGPDARLRDVNAIMAASPNVQDVFVTSNGQRNERMVGWITNTMLAQHLG